MPNSANRNSGSNNGSKGQPKHYVSQSSEEKPNRERSGIKNGDHHKAHKGDTGRSYNQGRKEASGGSLDE